MITKNDRENLIEDFKQVFATKEDHNKQMEKLDKILAELETSRGEQTLLTNTQSEHTEELEKHDKRIKRVENKLELPPLQ